MHLLLLLAVFDSSVARGAHPLQRSAAIMAATRQVCGDGTYESPESCDDGNIASGDGCSSTCTVEAGYACTGSPSICVDDPQFYAPLQTDLVDDVGAATPTFARGSTATRTVWNAGCTAATLSTVASGEPRYNSRCDSGSTLRTGLFVEAEVQNVSLQSQTLGTWSVIRSTIEIDQVVALDGTTTADYLREDGTVANNHYCSTPGFTQVNATQYVMSIYAKAGTRGYIRLGKTASPSTYTDFKLDDCTVCAGGYSGAAASSSGGGWCRVGIPYTSTSDSTGAARVYVGEACNDVIFDGVNEADSIALWGAQIEVDSGTGRPSSYISTTTTAVTRAADALSYAYAGTAAGTLTASVLCPDADQTAAAGLLSLSNGTVNESMVLSVVAAGDAPKWTITDGGAAQAAITGTTDLYSNALKSLRATWSTTSNTLYVGGASEGTPDTSATMPTTTTLYIGDHAGASQAGCLISDVKLYNEVVAP